MLALVNTVPFPQLQAFLAVARARSFSGAARDLGVSRSAVSQSVRQLEDELRLALVARTTRSVSLTDAGRRLLESAGPAVAQVRAALVEVTAKPGEVVGRLRLTVPRAAFQLVIAPVLAKFRERHPRIDVELVFEDRRVDIVAEGYDAGIRLSEYVERDMVSGRLTDPFRFVVVGAPGYLDEHGGRAKVIAEEPVGRMGRPEEIAAAVIWLCSDAAAFVVGHALVVDGGQTVQ